MSPTTLTSDRLSGDGGAVIVEAALVLPLLVILLCGVIDFGIGLRTQTSLQTATRNAARAGAAAVDNTSADQLVLSTLAAGTQGVAGLDITKVIVYEARTADGQPTSDCMNTAPSGLSARGDNGDCNIYSPQQIAAASATPETFVESGAGCSGWDGFWCPATMRTANLSGTVDSLGLWVEATYTPYTGVFGSDPFDISDYVVMKLEPSPV